MASGENLHSNMYLVKRNQGETLTPEYNSDDNHYSKTYNNNNDDNSNNEKSNKQLRALTLTKGVSLLKTDVWSL